MDSNCCQVFHEKMSFSELYRHTGCQFQPFNTIYQLYHEKLNGRLEGVEELEANTRKQYEKLYIVGGGAKNAFLNHLTEEATGKQVISLPIEATALGNLKIQMEADK